MIAKLAGAAVDQGGRRTIKLNALSPRWISTFSVSSVICPPH
ncbi:MAG: hypothetical protein OEY85_15740 [Rhodospirillales bacterium]|nr:hypothetical protein [Rhodospirillales bacterium]